MGIDIAYDHEGWSVWNTGEVQTILGRYKRVRKLNPYDWRFARKLKNITLSKEAQNISLAGELHGYPKAAIESFARFGSRILPIASELWGKAREADLELVTPLPKYLASIVEDKETRDEFLRYAAIFGIDFNLRKYVKYMRFADVPGIPYLTVGNTTLKDEARLREQYASSGFENKFQDLMDEHLGLGCEIVITRDHFKPPL